MSRRIAASRRASQLCAIAAICGISHATRYHYPAGFREKWYVAEEISPTTEKTDFTAAAANDEIASRAARSGNLSVIVVIFSPSHSSSPYKAAICRRTFVRSWEIEQCNVSDVFRSEFLRAGTLGLSNLLDAPIGLIWPKMTYNPRVNRINIFLIVFNNLKCSHGREIDKIFLLL